MKLPDWLRLTPSPDLRKYPTDVWAKYWNGAAMVSGKVLAMSGQHVCICTSDRWYPGTIVNVTISSGDGAGKQLLVTVPCRVSRHFEDGMEVEFVFTNSRDRKTVHAYLRNLQGTEKGESGAQSGQALLEFALSVPLLIFLVFNAVNFGGFLYAWVTISNAARAGVQYAAMGAAYAGTPASATSANITTLIQNETASLPGTAPTVTVCQTHNGSWIVYPLAATNTACPLTGLQADPETISSAPGASSFTAVAIDVSYTFSPFVSGFNIALVPTNVRMRTTMRLLN